MAIKTHMITGEAKWAKILGDAPPGYDNGPAEWTLDVVLDDKAKAAYLKSGGSDFYIKEDKEGNDFIKFVRKALKKDGSKSKPIHVVGPDGKDWDQTKLIGNGSILNVRYTLNEATHKGKTRMKPSLLEIQVWEHKPFVSNSKFPTREVPPEAAEDTSWAERDDE